jgi:4-oxalocrotonate tautomerase
MPMIQVTMLEGRTVEQKHALIRELTDAAVRALGVPAERVRVALNVVTPDEWGIGGVPVALARPAAPTEAPAT